MASHYSFDTGGWRIKEIYHEHRMVYMERIPNWDDWLSTEQGEEAVQEGLMFWPGKVFPGWRVELITPSLPEGTILTGIPVYIG